ncbi:MAG: serine/threonine protein phosphatase PrpC [Bradymonadia bacterium]|jgi:serine/threonine protein phosphatase PrpC
MRIEVSAASDVGRRREKNEDSFVSDPSAGIYIVCDGMGGHASGEVASATAANSLHGRLGELRGTLTSLLTGELEQRQEAAELVRSAVAGANEDVRAVAAADPAKRGMGTTLTMVFVSGNRALVAHVGDSRLYLCRGGQTHLLTTDHTILTEMIRAGRVRLEEAADAKHLNALTRAIGVYAAVDVDVTEVDLLPDDVLLLCSDGLHNYFEDFDLATFLDHSEIAGAASDLVEFANKMGGHDNITALTLLAHGDGETEQTQRVRLTLDTLRDIPLFHYLTFGELLKVITVCRPMFVPKDFLVVEEGTRGDELYIVVDGALRVHRSDTALAEISAGQHFGEMSLVDNRPRSASVTSNTQCHLIRVDRDDFYEVLRQDSVLAVKLLWNFIQTLSSMVRMQNDDINPIANATRGDELAHPYNREDEES